MGAAGERSRLVRCRRGWFVAKHGSGLRRPRGSASFAAGPSGPFRAVLGRAVLAWSACVWVGLCWVGLPGSACTGSACAGRPVLDRPVLGRSERPGRSDRFGPRPAAAADD